jgi:hypothetical protein
MYRTAIVSSVAVVPVEYAARLDGALPLALIKLEPTHEIMVNDRSPGDFVMRVVGVCKYCNLHFV